MTRKKSIYQLILAFAILASFFITSCSGLFNNEIEEPVETAVLNISLNEKTTRNILPQVSQLTNFKLTGTRGGETTTLGEWSSTEQLSEASIPLQVGEWNLTLTAKHNDVNFSGSATVNIERGKRNMASFILATQSTENGTAVVNVTFSTTYRVKAVRVIFGTSELATGEYNLSTSRINFTKTVTAGNYPLTIYFYSDVNKTESLGYYSDFVTVTSGLETTANITVDYFSETPVFESIRNIENGIELKVTVPANTTCEIVRREITSDTQLSEPTTSWCFGARSIAILANNLTSEPVTKTIKSQYGIQKDKKYQYGMLLNWGSTPSPESIAIVAENDGWAIPVFTTKMKSEVDATRHVLKYTRKPVLQFKNGETHTWRVKSCYIRRFNDNYGNQHDDWDFFYTPFYLAKEDNDESEIQEKFWGMTVQLSSLELEIDSDDDNAYTTYIHYENDGHDVPATIYTQNKIEETSEGIKIKFSVPKNTYYIRMFRKIGNGDWIKIMDCWNGPSNPISELQSWQFCDKYDYQANVENQYYFDYCYIFNGSTVGHARFDSNQGVSYTPHNNGIHKPSFAKVPAASFDGEKLTISKDFNVIYYNNESGPDSRYIPYLNFCFIDENHDEIWCYYRPSSQNSVYDLYNGARNNKTYTLQYFYLGFHWPDNQNIASRWEYYNNAENASLFDGFQKNLHFADKRPAMTLTTSPAASFDGKTFTMTSHAVASFTGAGEGYSYRTEIVYRDYYDPYDSSKKITIIDDGTFTYQNLYSEQNTDAIGTVKVLESATIILSVGSDVFRYSFTEAQLASLPSRIDIRPVMTLSILPAATFDGKNYVMTSHAVAGFTGVEGNYSYQTEIVYKDADYSYDTSRTITIIDNQQNELYNTNLYTLQTAGSLKILDSATVVLINGSKTFRYTLSSNQIASLPQLLDFDDDRPIPQLAVETTNEGVQLMLSNIPENISSVLIRRNSDSKAYSSLILIQPLSDNTFTFKDCFVQAGKKYSYCITDLNGMVYENLRKHSVTATSGFGDLFITNSPAATYDNTNKTVTFSIEPVLSIESLDEKLSAISNAYDVEAHFFYGKGENPMTFPALIYDFNNSKSVQISWQETGEFHLYAMNDILVHITTNDNKRIDYSYGSRFEELPNGMPTITIE